MKNRIILSAVVFAGALVLALMVLPRDDMTSFPEPDLTGIDTETATFSGGCFWGWEELFARVPGVLATRVGYTGGTQENPTYSQVTFGKSGHTEAVEVIFDPSRVSFSELVREYFGRRLPHTSDSPEVYATRHYRSSIFVHSAAQREQAETVISEINDSPETPHPVSTLVETAGRFWEAEEYHQDYYRKLGVSCPIGN